MEIYFITLNFFILFGSIFYLLNIQLTFKRLFSCLILNSLIAFVATQFPYFIWLSFVLSILFSGGLFYFITKKGIVFLHVIIIQLITILIEYISLLFVNQFELSLFIHGLLIVLMFTTGLYLYKRLINNPLYTLDFSAKLQRLLLFVSLITFIVFYLTVFAPSTDDEINVSFLNFGILVSYFLFLFISSQLLIRTIRKEALLNQKDMEQRYFYEYIHGLEEINREIRSIQHDYSNILLSLYGYIENEDLKGLKSYFEKTILQTNQQQINCFQQLENIKIMELKGLIGSKLLRAQSLNITVQIEVPEKIESISTDLMDLTRIIGIFLDNAIEATLQHTQPQIQVAFLHTNVNELVIVIQNTTIGQYVDIKQLFDENFSTKGENRGFGLHNVKQLLERYPNILLNTYLEQGCFIQEMVIEREDAK